MHLQNGTDTLTSVLNRKTLDVFTFCALLTEGGDPRVQIHRA
jgi:hypothetical protein